MNTFQKFVILLFRDKFPNIIRLILDVQSFMQSKQTEKCHRLICMGLERIAYSHKMHSFIRYRIAYATNYLRVLE